MPTLTFDQRKEIVQKMDSYERIPNIAQEFGVSVRTIYNIRDRYERLDDFGLKNLSRAPLNHPTKISPDVRACIVREALNHPGDGPAHIVNILKSQGLTVSSSTIHRTLSEEGLGDRKVRIHHLLSMYAEGGIQALSDTQADQLRRFSPQFAAKQMLCEKEGHHYILLTHSFRPLKSEQRSLKLVIFVDLYSLWMDVIIQDQDYWSRFDKNNYGRLIKAFPGGMGLHFGDLLFWNECFHNDLHPIDRKVFLNANPTWVESLNDHFDSLYKDTRLTTHKTDSDKLLRDTFLKPFFVQLRQLANEIRRINENVSSPSTVALDFASKEIRALVNRFNNTSPDDLLMPKTPAELEAERGNNHDNSSVRVFSRLLEEMMNGIKNLRN